MNEKNKLSPLFVEVVRFNENDVIATSGLLDSLLSELTNDNKTTVDENFWE